MNYWSGFCTACDGCTFIKMVTLLLLGKWSGTGHPQQQRHQWQRRWTIGHFIAGESRLILFFHYVPNIWVLDWPIMQSPKGRREKCVPCIPSRRTCASEKKKSPGPYGTAAAGQQCQQHQHPNCLGPFVNLYIQLRAPYVPLLSMNHFSWYCPLWPCAHSTTHLELVSWVYGAGR